MSEIPQDIIEKARRCYDALGRGSVSDSEHIARAIMAERERCAKIAEQYEEHDYDSVTSGLSDEIRAIQHSKEG